MLIAAFVLGGLSGLQATPSQGAAVSQQRADDRVEARPLTDVRERLEHRRALQRSLQAQVNELAAEIEKLRVRHRQTSPMLQSQRQEALVLERRLDWLVPRFLARMAEARQRRMQAARALAELAGSSRSPRLDPKLRARLLALGPVLLERWRDAEGDLRLLEELPDQSIRRHAEVERRLATLTAALQRWRRKSEEHRQLRAAALDRLRGVRLEVQALNEEQARLASRFLHGEMAIMARVEPQAGQPALPQRGPGRSMLSALVDKGALGPTRNLAQVVDARGGAASRVVAEATLRAAHGDAGELAADAGSLTKLPSTARKLTVAARRELPPAWPGASREAINQTAALDVVFVPDRRLPERPGAPARGERALSPLLPVPETARRLSVAGRGRPELAIPANPGQAIAAPVDGKVVFAGRFKSYGLLLILEHQREYHTLLWGLAQLDVERGDQVHVGQIVGIMDARGEGPPVLHVERRRNGRPIDLAASSSGIQG